MVRSLVGLQSVYLLLCCALSAVCVTKMTFPFIEYCLRVICSYSGSLHWTERHLVNATFRYIGHCLRDIWHVVRFIILDIEVCLLYRTAHYIGHRDIQCM